VKEQGTVAATLAGGKTVPYGEWVVGHGSIGEQGRGEK